LTEPEQREYFKLKRINYLSLGEMKNRKTVQFMNWKLILGIQLATVCSLFWANANSTTIQALTLFQFGLLDIKVLVSIEEFNFLKLSFH